jgi:hypothetical protein
LIKHQIRGQYYSSEQSLVASVEGVIDDLTLNRNLTSINSLPARWRKVNETGGDYIDNRNF